MILRDIECLPDAALDTERGGVHSHAHLLDLILDLIIDRVLTGLCQGQSSAILKYGRRVVFNNVYMLTLEHCSCKSSIAAVLTSWTISPNLPIIDAFKIINHNDNL